MVSTSRASFRRNQVQAASADRPYVADFACFNRRLVLEIDGGQHAESETDRLRDQRLTDAGFRVLRFWNSDLLARTDTVLELIMDALKDEGSPSPGALRAPPSPLGEGRSETVARSVANMSIINSVRSQLAPIHPQGYPFIGGFALASLILFFIWTPLGWIGTLATAWCAYFFRDPVRVTPLREGLVVSPADGRVSRVVNAVPPPELGLSERPLPRISIFMSVFDCHVNRSPMSGRIERMVYRAGKFINADLDKASEDNERNALIIATRACASRSCVCRSPGSWRGGSCRSCAKDRPSSPATGSA